MMIPFEAIMIPMYMIAVKLGLQNTYRGLILPSILDTFGVFQMRQYLLSFPDDIIDAGRIDEDEVWRRFTQITDRPVPPHQGSIMGRFFTPHPDQATVDVINELKARGIRVVCGTNTGDAHYTVHRQLNQYSMFDQVYASHLIHLAKPDPAFYTHILDAEHVKPEEAFFTDDWPPNAEVASKLGIASFTYTGADTLRDQLRSLGISI